MNAPTPEPNMETEQGPIHAVRQDPEQPSHLDPSPPPWVPPRPAAGYQPPKVDRYRKVQRAACEQQDDVYLDWLETLQVQDQADGRRGGGEGVDEPEVERVILERPRGDDHTKPLEVEGDPDADAVATRVRWYMAKGHCGRPRSRGSGRPTFVAHDKDRA